MPQQSKQDAAVVESSTTVETGNGDLTKKLVATAVAFGVAAIAAGAAAFAQSKRTTSVTEIVEVVPVDDNTVERKTTTKTKKPE
jgi:hypothetical protein